MLLAHMLGCGASSGHTWISLLWFYEGFNGVRT